MRKAPARPLDDDAAPLDEVLYGPTWLERVAEARMRREKVLAERARAGRAEIDPPPKPWEAGRTARALGNDPPATPPPLRLTETMRVADRASEMNGVAERGRRALRLKVVRRRRARLVVLSAGLLVGLWAVGRYVPGNGGGPATMMADMVEAPFAGRVAPVWVPAGLASDVVELAAATGTEARAVDAPPEGARFVDAPATHRGFPDRVARVGPVLVLGHVSPDVMPQTNPADERRLPPVWVQAD